MDQTKNRRKYFFANAMHREIFLLVFLATLVPMVFTAVSLFYLIFNITADQVGIPEAIAYSIFPAARRVMTILCFVTPIAVIAVLVFAYKVTHRIVGPFDRVVRELDECISGRRQGPIILRSGDKFQPLIDNINSLLDKLRIQEYSGQ